MTPPLVPVPPFAPVLTPSEQHAAARCESLTPLVVPPPRGKLL